jgi:radical SAM protein with 4Fe4S-binding SPASM domain
VNTVVNENTYTRLTEVAGIARRKGADAVNFIQGWAVPERIGRAHEKACMDSLGIAAPSWKGFEREGPGMDIAELAAAMREIREYQKEVGLLKFYFLPDIGPDELEAFYSGMNVAGHERCYSLWTRADIRFNGDVVFCGDYPDYAAGNIRDGAFLRIWNGEKAAKFRQSVKKNKVLPVCCMCCNLYQYNWPRA